MSVENFERIASQLKEFTDYVYQHVQGEPTGHKQFESIVQICNKYNLKVCLTTNGTMLDKVCEAIERGGKIHKVNISLQAVSGNLTLDPLEYMSKVVMLANKINTCGSIIVYRLWNEGGDVSRNPQLISFLNDMYNVDIIGNTKLCEKTFFEVANEFEWRCADEKTDIFCYGLKDQFGILSNGDVVPCCLDYDADIVLGNVFVTSLKGILDSQRAKDIKNAFQQRKAIEHRCKHCGFPRKF